MPVELPPLADQHCHGVLRTDPSPSVFESLLSESDTPAAPGTSFLDTQLGFAVLRCCPPVLGLEAHSPPARYLARRSELGPHEATRLLLRASGIHTFLVDTGLPGELTGPHELAALGGGTAREIVRLELMAERAADTAASAHGFLTAIEESVQAAARRAAGFKSVAGYRHGLDFDPTPPSRAEVREAASRWLSTRHPGERLSHPVLLRHLLWSAVATSLPLQLHTGFGDPDLRLHRCDPLLLTDFIKAVQPTGCPLILLHGYPYHRGAGYLAHVFPHVYADMGLALTYTGARAEAVLAEMLELTPFGKLLFSTDAYGLPELYVVGAQLFREGLSRLLTRWVDEGAWSAANADRVAGLISAGNARRVYA